MNVIEPKPTNTHSFNIGRRQSDGLHAFLASNGLWTWRNAGEVSHVVLPPLDYAQPSCDFAGDHLIIANIGVGVGQDGPMKIVELDVENLTFSDPFLVGDNGNREPVVRGLAGGTCAVVSYTAHSTTDFDLSYRNLAGEWSTQRHHFEPGSGIPASRWEIVQGTDGVVWIFGIQDAFNRLMVFRFVEQSGGLTFLDENTMFITGAFHNGVQDPFAPMAELPWLHARTDHARNRVVLAVQKYEYTWECGTILSPTQILAFPPGPLDRASVSLVGDIHELQGHGNPCYLFPRPDGIYWAQTVNRNCEPTERFLFGGFRDNGGPLASLDTPKCHPFMACSDDGWCVRRLIFDDWSDTNYELGKLPLPPALRMMRLEDHLEIDWDQQTSDDVLESSPDQVNWEPYYVGLPPVVIQPEDAHLFFRVHQPIRK